jgi:SAM-dependent methyltransferase
MIDDHDQELSQAFDRQAPRFERAPVQSDPVALRRLAEYARFPKGGRVLDAGCGPGLVSEALLEAGCRVVGVDLSREMIDRARVRCARWKEAAVFHQGSLFDPMLDRLAPFDGALSRYVLHHVLDQHAFITRQALLLPPGGILVCCDHVTDPDPGPAAHHEAIEKARDKTHTANLTGGRLVDLLAETGLDEIELIEERFTLDFDEWFDRGTPLASKDNVRALLLNGPPIRSFRPTIQPDGSVQIAGIRATVRGVKPGGLD